MKKISLIFKGDARVMCFGKDRWDMRKPDKPECNHSFIGFTRIESINCRDRDIVCEVSSMLMSHFLDGIHSDRFNYTGEYLLSFDDLKNVEVPVTLDVDDDFDVSSLIILKDNSHFEGEDEFCIPNLFYVIKNDDLRLAVGNFDKKVVEDIMSKCDFYKDCANRLFSERDIQRTGMYVIKQTHPMTEICVGEKNAFVPCVVAENTKHLINKFRLEVADIEVAEPYYIDDWQYQDHYELIISVKPAKVMKTRKCSNAYKRTYMRFIKRYGWDLTIVAL